MSARFLNKKLAIAAVAFLCILALAAGFFCKGLLEKGPAPAFASIEFDSEGLPRMAPYDQALYDAYLSPVAVTGLLWRDFSPEDMSSLYEEADFLVSLAAALGKGEAHTYFTEGLLPAGYVDELLTRYFALQPDSIRRACAESYIPEKDAYAFYGLGGGPAQPIVTGSRLEGRQMTVFYTWYLGDPGEEPFSFRADCSGELVIDFSGDFVRYISNKILP